MDEVSDAGALGGTQLEVAATGRRRPRWFALGLAGALLAAAGLAVAVVGRPDAPGVTAARAPRPAPVFDVPGLRDEGSRVRLADQRGKPVVLNFWASWCVPCQREMAAFASVNRRLGETVTFVGMNNQDNREDALALLDRTGVGYGSGFDPQGSVARAYGLYGMPTTVFISADGRRLATRTGEMTERELLAATRQLFGVAAP